VFVSAFLLFQVQPITARYILPWYGGTPAVWTTCMLFFQIFLFLGYAYAYALQRWLKPVQQTLVHAALLIGALWLLPIVPVATFQGAETMPPVIVIITILATSVGIPYFFLSSTGPLLQVWFAHVNPNLSPYPLYAISNAGSFLALLSYPFLIEPIFSLTQQVTYWSWSFVVFAVLCGLVALQLVAKRKGGEARVPERLEATPKPDWKTRYLWIFLPALASVTLLSLTTLMTQDISAVPLLWVVPLSIYLLTFILCFESQRWYHPVVYRWLLFGLLVLLVSIVAVTSNSFPIGSIFIYCSILFVTCMICHGALEKLKPAPDHLTHFYLMISAGGALGGISVGILAPLLFNSHTEVLICYVLFLALVFFPIDTQGEALINLKGKIKKIAVGILYCLFVAALASDYNVGRDGEFRHYRNFYGVLAKFAPENGDETTTRYLKHGRVLHGLQFIAEDRQHIATTYYGSNSAIGRAFEITQPQRERDTRNIGAVGLGIGTIATYGTPQDTMRFYEINPKVVEVAEKDFTFLSKSKANVSVVVGDALISMQNEPPQNYDVLVLDAFSGDAIPVHLLTKEAFEVYVDHMAKDGLIAVHISNKYLDLRPVLWALADHFGFESTAILSSAIEEDKVTPAYWLVLSKDKEKLARLSEIEGHTERDPSIEPILWTNDFSNIFSILGAIK
jgi:hypothetical protein